ncbi:L,D-transpeptidase family protein [Nocardioides sp. JQ2195]|uniref:L,D-transpeptidase family protein n=1 Tax=Nocardioides sp. JQ2195 TaxID=2592334 RepID=UPI00143E3EE2|nr:peptidoglycan-binding protein [Nocardioides sp. JQ2195]QIX28127.1 L,D-transpeptidase family protein [Nocardioides sp. JQ2195]
MRALRIFFLTVIALVLMSATAFGAGVAVRHLNEDSATAAPSQATAKDTGRDGTAGTPRGDADEQDVPVKEVKPAKPSPVLQPGDKGEQVRELQHRLFQMQWLPERTTGVYDGTTEEAVAGWQEKRGLEATGVMDQKSWHRLVRMTETPTHDQMFNILRPGPAILSSGDSGEDVRDLQARLKAIQWLSGLVTGTYDPATVAAVKGFQEKRQIPVTGEVDQRTMDRLHAMTSTPSHDAKHNIAPDPGGATSAALDSRCTTGRVLCIDKTSRTLRWVVDGKVLQTLDVRFGSTLNNTPTREGTFHVGWKDIDHVSNEFGSAMPFSMFFSGGQAVHYSSDFAARGYAGASHGCVNVRDYNGLAWLYEQVAVGDKVVVYWS